MAKLDLLASDRTYYAPVRINYFCTEQARKNIRIVKGDFTNWNMTSSIFSNLKLEDVVVSKGTWFEIHFDTLFMDGRLKNIDIKDCSFDKGNFDFSTWNDVSIEENTIFTGCSFKYVIFTRCNFKHVEFRDCTFSKCTFSDCTFDGVYSKDFPQLNRAVGFKRCFLEFNTWNRCNFKNNEDEDGLVAYNIPTKYSTSFIRCTGNGNGLKYCRTSGLNFLIEGTKKLLPNVIENYPPLTLAVVPAPSLPNSYKEDDDEDDAYIQALMGRFPHYSSYNTYKPNYSTIPAVTIVKNKWAFVFSTPGVSVTKKTKTEV